LISHDKGLSKAVMVGKRLSQLFPDKIGQSIRQLWYAAMNMSSTSFTWQ